MKFAKDLSQPIIKYYGAVSSFSYMDFPHMNSLLLETLLRSSPLSHYHPFHLHLPQLFCHLFCLSSWCCWLVIVLPLPSPDSLISGLCEKSSNFLLYSWQLFSVLNSYFQGLLQIFRRSLPTFLSQNNSIQSNHCNLIPTNLSVSFLMLLLLHLYSQSTGSNLGIISTPSPFTHSHTFCEFYFHNVLILNSTPLPPA